MISFDHPALSGPNSRAIGSQLVLDFLFLLRKRRRSREGDGDRKKKPKRHRLVAVSVDVGYAGVGQLNQNPRTSPK